MRQGTRKHGAELPSWPVTILRKWLNVSSRDSDFSADYEEVEKDLDDEEDENDLDYEEMCGWKSEIYHVGRRMDRLVSNVSTSESIPYKIRRRKSETLRAQYINTKELKICVGTWNVGGKFPPNDLEMEEWLDMEEPADIYVLGLQEIVPLNAGNIFGAEDNRPVSRWESIIRETLDRILPTRPNFKCHSHPASPSRFKPTDDAPTIEELLLSETESENEAEVHPLDDQSFSFHFDKDSFIVSVVDSECTGTIDNTGFNISGKPEQHVHSSKRLNRPHQFNSPDCETNPETSVTQQKIKLTRTLSSSERIGLSWPEQPLNLLPQRYFDNSNSLKAVRSFRASKSYKSVLGENKGSSGKELIPELNKLDIHTRKRSAFVRIISKQMVGIFLTIWVRRSLRKHIQNVKVSTVGVGVMGYIGNKGSISVSMSIYQTLFCFICSHLTSGEKEGDELRRNADVREILRRTRFNDVPGMTLPRTVHDHERIIWLGDLNYRINLPYDKTRELIFKKEWSMLVEKDQLKRELKKGRAFDGWTEGVLNFPPTYKYEFNSEKYIGDDPKSGRRTPAWCDRILSFGKGMRLLDYRRSELTLSDHRPVTAVFTAEVEVFCHRKLQRALLFTDAEIEDCAIL